MTAIPSFTFMLPMSTTCLSLPLRSAARRAGGFGLLQVMLLIAVMSGLATMGYLQWRERSALDSSRQERQALAQADQALIAYATVARSLPCPDVDRDGLQDCGAPATQKGWLPTVTLRMAGVDPGVDVGQLRYLVQRQGGANDLTMLTDTWTPLEYSDGADGFFAMRGAPYPADILTLTDLCQRLDTGRRATMLPTMALVNAPTPRAIAYALAHPGNNDADGDGDLFDGANSNAAANVNRMEDPNRRSLLAGYNDIVLERSYDSLLSAFHCRPLIDSINTVALAHDVAGDVAEMRADNIESARRSVAFSTLAAIMTSLEIALAVAEGASDAGNAAAEWAICAASLGLAVNACAAAPQHTVAIGLAGGVIIANGLAVVANAVAAGIAGTALTLADSSATANDICPPMDPAVNNLMLSIAQQEVTDANAELAAATTAVNNKTAELNTAIAQRTAAVNSLNSLIRNGQASSQIDGLLNTLLAAAGTWGSTSYASAAADSKVTQATQLRDRWATEVSKYNAMLADIPGTISRLNSEIAALDLLIATNPPNKTDLQNERDGKDAERKLAGDVAGLTAVRDKAVAELAIAQTALDNAVAAQTAASAAYSTAQTSYQSAISNFVNGTARYNIYNSSGAVVAYGCTTACQAGDVNINSVGQLGSALVDLFGLGAMTSPSTDAKYLKPVKLQKELDALNQRLAAAQDRKATADARLLEAQNRINNPPPCNATGSAVVPMTPEQAESILADVDRKGGTR